VSFFTPDNRRHALEVVARYPKKRSAMIPLLHLAQEQHGWISGDAMREIAELIDSTPSDVQGTCSFYEMFKREPVGTYLVNVCVTMSCQLMGAEALMHHAEKTLGIRAGSTTPDGMFTLEEAECQAACSEAPCLQVNYRHRYRVTPDDFDDLIGALRSGDLEDEIPGHGVLARVRQVIPADRATAVEAPEDVTGPPVWMPEPAEQGN
jgi:NADH-quinone oxidoreductase subunit E